MLTYEEARAVIDPHITMPYRGHTWEDLRQEQDDRWHEAVIRQLRVALGDSVVVAAHGAVRDGESRESWLGEIFVLTESAFIVLRFTAERQSHRGWALVPEVRTYIYPRSTIKRVDILGVSERDELEARILIAGDGWQVSLPTEERRRSVAVAQMASQLVS